MTERRQPDITEKLTAWHDRLCKAGSLTIAERIDLRSVIRETLDNLRTLRMSPAEYEREAERVQLLLMGKEAA
ncbi:MAG: hypothetical protein KF889_25510 [Alphaproteobacteria bacterium]|nr:hypothetical protein [Alphaproteobacteria bacterium]MCW5739647.1 hypothetical protein [Alphaproteobacteria bacterium]